MRGSLEFEAISRVDNPGEEYYFTTPNLPVLVDLSSCVIFIRPYFDEERGQKRLQITIKAHDRKFKSGGENK